MKILFIRRDNIGDLLCTTPAVRAARLHFPDATIGMLVNTYNAEAVMNNPDIDRLYMYEKAKHAVGKGKLSVWRSNLDILRRVRSESYDVAIGCGSYSKRLARYTFFTGAPKRIGYVKENMRAHWYTLPLTDREDRLHEVERTFRLLEPLGIGGEPPPMRVVPGDGEVRRVQAILNRAARGSGPVIAFHISSRRKENRWDVNKFIQLGERLSRDAGAVILLLWAPGSHDNVTHPGDDEMAATIVDRMEPKPVACPTTRLAELIAALSISDFVVCCDGGAMHIAAALGKPLVVLWGSTDPARWRPWKTKHVLVSDGTGRAEHVPVEAALEAIKSLLS
ncbi:MAG TPA: glycosyltransferase family 9 protein [Dissulfurispiraceae bacterium]|nr:glycosyltransferase family 9 protein [Dissulfurispiraceae bacterium]